MLAHLDEIAPQLRVCQVQLRHPLVVADAVVGARLVRDRVGVYEEPVAVSRGLAVFDHILKGRPPVAAVVEYAVQQHADAERVRVGGEGAQVLLRAEVRVDAVVVHRVVLVVGRSLEHRRDVETGRAEGRYVGQLFTYAAQVAAHEILARRGSAPGVRALRRERGVAVLEPLGKQLVVDLARAPVRGLETVLGIGPEELEEVLIHARLRVTEAVRPVPKFKGTRAQAEAVAYVRGDVFRNDLRLMAVPPEVTEHRPYCCLPSLSRVRLAALPPEQRGLVNVAPRGEEPHGQRISRLWIDILGRGAVGDRCVIHGAPPLKHAPLRRVRLFLWTAGSGVCWSRDSLSGR